jgi:hypothetical protein
MENTTLEQQRKRYEKPEAIRFPLRPDEAVLGFCKSVSHGATGGGLCGKVGGCPNAGS